VSSAAVTDGSGTKTRESPSLLVHALHEPSLSRTGLPGEARVEGDPGALRPLSVTIALAGWLSASCRREITRSEVLGRYVSDESEADTLELRPDGAYVHRFLMKEKTEGTSGRPIEERGTWDIDVTHGDSTVTFNDFFPSWGSFLPRRRGFWIVEPERSLFRGNVRLCIDPDLNHYYLKQ
jgi:hypothetical protein